MHPSKRLQTTYRIAATGGYQSPIRADSHTFNPSASAVGDLKGLRRPVCHIPNPRRTIVRPRDKQSPVRRERERVDLLGVTLEFFVDLLLGNIPNLECQESSYVEHSPEK